MISAFVLYVRHKTMQCWHRALAQLHKYKVSLYWENQDVQPSVSRIKELLSYQPEKMQEKITDRSFSQGTHLKTLGKLTKKLEIAHGGKHAKQVPLSVLILTVSQRGQPNDCDPG